MMAGSGLPPVRVADRQGGPRPAAWAYRPPSGAPVHATARRLDGIAAILCPLPARGAGLGQRPLDTWRPAARSCQDHPGIAGIRPCWPGRRPALPRTAAGTLPGRAPPPCPAPSSGTRRRTAAGTLPGRAPPRRRIPRTIGVHIQVSRMRRRCGTPRGPVAGTMPLNGGGSGGILCPPGRAAGGQDPRRHAGRGQPSRSLPVTGHVPAAAGSVGSGR